MLKLRENRRVDPHLYNGEISCVQIRDPEAWKAPKGEFYRLLTILVNFRIFDNQIGSKIRK